MNLGARTEWVGWTDRPVLVTGVTGSLGRALSGLLAGARASVIGLTRRTSDDLGVVPYAGPGDRVRTVCGSVIDFGLLESLVRSAGIEMIFHLAAVTPPAARRNPREAFETNVRGTWNVLEAARVSGRPVQVILASTQEVYGEASALPYREDLPLGALLPYGASKVCAEHLGRSYWHAFGMPVAIGRITMLYGGGDLNENRLIPGTIRSVLQGERPLIRSDGRMRRDYVYVEDAARALLLLAEASARPDVAGEAFNVGTEEPRSVLEVVQTILRLMDREDLAPEVLDQASGEIPIMYASAHKLRERLGWAPRHSFEDGLRRTIMWYRGVWGSRASGGEG